MRIGPGKTKSRQSHNSKLWIPPLGSFGLQRLEEKHLGRSRFGSSKRGNLWAVNKESSSWVEEISTHSSYDIRPVAPTRNSSAQEEMPCLDP